MKVWAWNNTENCCANNTWPGDAMTEKNGVLYWEAPKGKVPTQIISAIMEERRPETILSTSTAIPINPTAATVW